MSRKVRYGVGAAGAAMLVGLYFVRGGDEDMPAWVLGLFVGLAVVLSVVQDVILYHRTPRQR